MNPVRGRSPSEPKFIHLRLHSEYSLVDGLIRIKPCAQAARAAGMPALALTDQGNLFALVKFYSAAHSAGIKPIIGVDAWVRELGVATPCCDSRLVLLCQNLQGYRNLTELVSRAYQHGQDRGIPYLDFAWLEGHSEGLIALSGGREGNVGQALLAHDTALAKARLAAWERLFGRRFYLELQRTGREREEEYLRAAVELAAATQTPVVATNDVRFLAPEDFEAHEVRVCIHAGHTLADPARPQAYSKDQYLRTPQEMVELFADIPEAIENTWHIAQRCNLELTLGRNFLPQFPVPDGQAVAEWFRAESRRGLETHLDFLFPEDKAARRAPYDARLELEVDVIAGMDFPGYFLIVADFIQWAKNHNIPVGPGRGSGAGSLVAYALGITDLDPLQYDLLFERFLNPERVSMPDFDVDFCMDRRDEVIEYVAERYGRDKVSQIITYGSLGAKAVVRDVGRVLGHPYGFVDQIAKLIPFDLGMTLDKALQEDSLRQRYEQEEEVKQLLDRARQLEGLARNAGRHAGGVVIAPSKLTDFAPLYCEADGSNLVTQFDKNDVETIGLVKFDFLGLRTLTIIQWALDTINHGATQILDIATIPLDDAPTFKLLKAAQTTAVFQLESRGMKELIKRMQPDCFEDLIALVALFRPGPLQSGMVDDFINRKHGKAVIEYLHKELQEHPDAALRDGLVAILKPTYGVIVYQEQVMQLGQVLAGYTLGGADLLRRAMGKKKPEEMAKQRAFFVDGCATNGIRAETAGYVFDLIEKFAGYGFNKSHSAAYALVSYQTAWLKAHYPAAFMAAVLSADMDNTDKIVVLIEECRAMGLRVHAPDINQSVFKFQVTHEPGAIRYGLGALKGAGEAALLGIVREREEHGPFIDLFDFTRRVDLRKCNRRVLESLIKSGAMDRLGGHRASLLASLDLALKMAEQHNAQADSGIHDMFASPSPSAQQPSAHATLVDTPAWPLAEQLGYELEILGLYVTGHPMDAFRDEIVALCKPLAEVKPNKNKSIKAAGLIVALRTMNSRRGKMAGVTLDDNTGRLEAVFFADEFIKYKELLEKDRILVVEGTVGVDSFSGGHSLSVREAWDIETARATMARHITISLRPNGAEPAQVVADLQAALTPHKNGQCPVEVLLYRDHIRTRLRLGRAWQVRPSNELLRNLQHLPGQEAVRVGYS